MRDKSEGSMSVENEARTVGVTQDPATLAEPVTRGTPAKTTNTILRVVRALNSAAKPGRPKPFAENLRQQTFQEVKTASCALADGASGQRWRNVVGEIALCHAITGETLQTQITANPSIDWWDHPASHEALRAELQTFSPETVLLFNLVIGLAIEKHHATIEIDELIRGLGWKIRTLTDRAEARRKVYRWLMLLQSITIHGRRVGKYQDRLTKEILDLSISSELIRITEKIFAEQQLELDGSSPPIIVTVSASAWLERLRENGQILQAFGNVRKLAGLPTGQPRGAWALSIGLTLNQLWRERCAQTEVHRVGESDTLTAKFRPFTRRELLKMFQVEPNFETILQSDKPHRAKDYWKDAISLLKKHGVIGFYKELETMPQARRGWQDFWLDGQRIDIRPKHEETAVVADISRAGAQARKRLKRKGKAA
jgi:hypothetical protein